MARLPFVDPENAPEATREIFEALPVKLNIFRMMAHAENSLRPLLGLGGSILRAQELGGNLRELIILEVAKLAGGEYEWVQHVPIGKAMGVTDDQIAALDRRDTAADCFSESEKALLRFTKEVSENVRVPEDVFDAMKAHFSSREIVESILTIGFYMMMARLTEATETDLDEPAGMTVVDSVPERS